MTQAPEEQIIRKIPVHCTLNGQPTDFLVSPYLSLLETLLLAADDVLEEALLKGYGCCP